MSAATLPRVDTLERIVIIGAGLSGLRAAEGARAAGFLGRLILIGDEPHLPYDRPPLSKAVLVEEDYSCYLSLLPRENFDALRIECKLGNAAVSIARATRHVMLQNGERVAYDRLVIATGSALRILSGLNRERPGVHYLRKLEDALALRRELTLGRRVLIVGAGVIGLEVAAAAVGKGCAVTVVEAGPRVMGRAASVPISDYVSARHRHAGVDLRLGVVVEDLKTIAHGVVAMLSDGVEIAADLVVVGVGVMPNDRLARECDLDVEAGGIKVDAWGMTNDPAIYAAGEVAVHFNARHGRHDRQETWAHAAAHGAHVGRSLVSRGRAYDALGSYWSDQYDFTLNVVGAPTGEADVIRGDPNTGQFVVLHLKGGRVVGVSAVNAARELRAAQALIGVDRAFEPQILADVAIDLRKLAKTEE